MNKFVKKTKDVEYVIETDDRETFNNIVNKILDNFMGIKGKEMTLDTTSKKRVDKPKVKTIHKKDDLGDIKRLPNDEDTYKLDPSDPNVVDLSKLNVQTNKTIETVDFACPKCHQHHAILLHEGMDWEVRNTLFSYPYKDDKEQAKPLYMVDGVDREGYFSYGEIRGFEYINDLFMKIAKNETLQENIKLLPDEETTCSCPICDYKGTTIEFHKAFKKKDDSSCPLCGNEGLILMLADDKENKYDYECEFCSEVGEPYYY